MYLIIGSDGREYGPVAAEQVRAWIAGGRANLETQAKLFGTDAWHRLGDFADFGGSLPEADALLAGAGSAGPAASAELPLGASPAAIAQRMIARNVPLDIGGCYERSWNLLKANFWPLVGITALITGLETVLGLNHVGAVAGALLSLVFEGGLYYYFLKKIRGQPTEVSDAFAGFSRALVPLILTGVVMAVLTCAGLVLLILPGVYLYVAYKFADLLVIDRGLGFWPALEVSRRVISAQWWRVLGLLLLALPFLLLGVAALGVGVLVVLPLIHGALVFAYLDLCAGTTSTAPSA
jgi:hypothetical protein